MLDNSTQKEEELLPQIATNMITKYAATATKFSNVASTHAEVIATSFDITTEFAEVHTASPNNITAEYDDVTISYDDVTMAYDSNGFDVDDPALSTIHGRNFSEAYVTSVTMDSAKGSSTFTVILATILLVITVVTIVGNILVIVSPLVDRKLRNTFTYYIINLGVTDFLVALSAMSFYSFDIMLGYWPFGEVMCGIWIFFDYGMTFASVFTLVVISLDRYWSVGWSLHYKSYNTPRKCAIMITIIWVAVFAVWLAPCILDRIRWSEADVCKWEPSKNREFVIFVAVVGHHTPCAVIIFCYLKIFSIMRAKKRTVAPAITSSHTTCNANLTVPNQTHKSSMTLTNRMQALQFENNKSEESKTQCPILPDNTTIFGIQANSQNDSAASRFAVGEKSTSSLSQNQDVYLTLRLRQKTKEDKEKKTFVMLTYILFSYLFCWLPFHIVFDVSSIRPDLVPEWIFTTTFWMTYCNSTINPFIYAFTSSSFRNAFMQIIKCRVPRQNIH